MAQYRLAPRAPTSRRKWFCKSRVTWSLFKRVLSTSNKKTTFSPGFGVLGRIAFQ
jgi:hypothetical protein